MTDLVERVAKVHAEAYPALLPDSDVVTEYDLKAARAAITETLEALKYWVRWHDNEPGTVMTANFAIEQFAAEHNIILKS